MRPPKAILTFALGLLGLPLVLFSAASAAAASDSESAATADAYRRVFGLSEFAAQNQASIADRITAGDSQNLGQKLRAAAGPAFAGTWFDVRGDGHFKVGVTSQDAASDVRAVLDGAGVSDIADVVVQRSTWTELTTANAAAAEVLSKYISAGSVSTSVDPAVNALVFYEANGVDDATGHALLAASKSASVATSIRRVDRASLTEKQYACTAPNCERPLRGGVRITNLDTDNCTSGFTAQSISDSTLYLLTAGHCVASSTAQWYGFIPGSFYPLPIGPRWRWVNGHSGDAASIQIASSSYWLSSPAPRGWVVVRPSSSTTANDRYPIYTEGYSSLNMPICLTGVYTGATGSAHTAASSSRLTGRSTTAGGL